jgi:hypothetical protein
MQVEIFCLCRAFEVNNHNQPTLTDVFDSVVSPTPSGLISPFFVVASVRFFKSEEGRPFRMSIQCKGPNGKQVLGGITDILQFKDLPKPSITWFYPHAVPAGFLSWGAYMFSIQVDGKQLASTPLYVERPSV